MGPFQKRWRLPFEGARSAVRRPHSALHTENTVPRQIHWRHMGSATCEPCDRVAKTRLRPVNEARKLNVPDRATSLAGKQKRESVSALSALAEQ